MAAMRRSRVALVAALSAVITVGLAFAPFEVAHRSPQLHIVLSTASGLVALFAAVLFFGRYAQGARLSNLTIGGALALFASANLFLSVPIAVAQDGANDAFSTWAPLSLHLLGAALFAVSPFLSGRLARQPRRTFAVFAASFLAAAVAAVSLVGILAARLPPALESGTPPEQGTWPPTGDPGVLAAQVVSVLLFAVAAAGFIRAEPADELARWLGPACVLGAFARLNYVLFPSVYSLFVSAGDLFRLAFYGFVCLGVAREVRRYQRAHSAAAVLDERRRIARNLHDGLAQELAFIVMKSRSLVSRADHSELDEITSAAERALSESRLAIMALARPGYEPLDIWIRDAASQTATRLGARLELDLEPGIDVSPARREALVRIVVESITNAVRHGATRDIKIELTRTNATRLRITDRGRGFVVAEIEARGGGFGLRSMRERAERIGGRLTIESKPNSGTNVEVAVP